MIKIEDEWFILNNLMQLINVCNFMQFIRRNWNGLRYYNIIDDACMQFV